MKGGKEKFLAQAYFFEQLLLWSGRRWPLAPAKSDPEQPLFHSLPEMAEDVRQERKLSWVDDYGKELVTEFYSISRRIPWKECCLIWPSQGLSPHGLAYRLE